MRPNRVLVFEANVSTWSASRTSTCSGSACPPAASTSAATVWMEPGSFSVGATLLAATTTEHPARANPSASARPMPRLAPVTIATRPCNEDMAVYSVRLPFRLAIPTRTATAFAER